MGFFWKQIIARIRGSPWSKMEFCLSTMSFYTIEGAGSSEAGEQAGKCSKAVSGSEPLCPDRVRRALGRIYRGKAAGRDGIPPHPEARE